MQTKWTDVSIGDIAGFLFKLTIASLLLSILWALIYFVGFLGLLAVVNHA
jgi:hypothetical protein